MGAAKLEPAPVMSAAWAMTGRALASRAQVSIRAGKDIILMFSDMKNTDASGLAADRPENKKLTSVMKMICP
ncbi:hypothetical protein AA15237_1249 [Komagataeibacter xylinus NBRC 15237]|nr:hypothetical protein AA15237_1249 [Komagataeibacter xylinus NBRC 15237]